MSLLLHLVKETNSVAQQIGLRNQKMEGTHDLDKATTETIEVTTQGCKVTDLKINIKHMVLVQHRHSHINMAKMRRRSP
jgi:hypothetical protein